MFAVYLHVYNKSQLRCCFSWGQKNGLHFLLVSVIQMWQRKLYYCQSFF